MHMRKPITRVLAEGLDAYATACGVSRAAAGRRAGIDGSTLWRAVHRGGGRATTLADFAEAVAAMAQGEDKGGEIRGLVGQVADWIGDRRGAPAPEEGLARLTVLAGGVEFGRRFGAPGHAFVALANGRALGGLDSPAERAALAALTLLMLERLG